MKRIIENENMKRLLVIFARDKMLISFYLLLFY